MKKLLFTGLALSMLFACNNPSQKSEGNTDSLVTSQSDGAAETHGGKIVFEEDKFDFGTVKEGTIVDHTFKFKNEGTEPVILAQVSTSCGCTTPNYTEQPVLPGKEGEITVSFNSTGHPGVQQKLITVSSNAENNILTLELKGTVEK